jgi:hypothetical protein
MQKYKLQEQCKNTNYRNNAYILIIAMRLKLQNFEHSAFTKTYL